VVVTGPDLPPGRHHLRAWIETAGSGTLLDREIEAFTD